ncbi:zinc finger protein 341-like isoform X3 [Pomacea canaliculata]|uniref:zinc finger protein 341-like isoform X3 n=1 Tax=Pomacea canaliculata TaxID=400727 RepID=UPI000D72E48E|nr:zinc finger protein 341-like isoform X3 [Pomacea canaliculata]
MERLTTNCSTTDTAGTCLTLCYQSLTGTVAQMGVDTQPVVNATHLGVDSQSAVSVSTLQVEGTGMTSIGIDGQGMGVDNQAAVAVQSLLESQQIQEANAEDEDVFQCGRCKKQFTSLNIFFTHKQTQCLAAMSPSAHLQQQVVQPAPDHQQTQLHQQQTHQQHLQQQVQQTLHQLQPLAHMQPVQNGIQTALSSALGSAGTTAFTSSICTVTQPLKTYATLPTSPLSQLPQGVVLTDDLMALTSLDPSSLQGSTIQMVAAPYNPRSSGSVTILSAVQPAPAITTAGATFAQHPPAQLSSFNPHAAATNPQFTSFTPLPTTTCSITPFTQPAMQTLTTQHHHQQQQQQPAPQSQQITITLPEKPTPTILRRTPTKAGRKSSQSQAAAGAVVISGEVDDGGSGRRGDRGAGGDAKRRSLQCQYCNKLFAKNFDLQQHIRAHTGEKPFQCIVCGRAFAQKSNVKKHMATHKVWPTGNSSTLPKQPKPQPMVHGEDNSLPESVEAETEEEVIVTVGEGHAVGLIKEEEADGDKGKVLESLSAVTNGQVKVRVVVDNSYICQYCAAKFKTFFQLKTHMVEHKAEQVYKCVMKNCGASFRELDSFLDHTKTHENEMTYRCHQCNKYFPSLYELGVHQYTHSLYPSQSLKSGPRHFQCTKCGNKYTTPEALEHHLATTTHQYPCPHCHKIFSCERFLRRHLPIHGSEGCNKEFNRPDKLKSHIITHSGIKPFKCSVCGKGFSRRPHLMEHERGHNADYRFKCEKCGKGYFRAKLFNVHKCQPDRSRAEPQLFRPRNRRKIGRPRKRLVTISGAASNQDDGTGSRRLSGKSGLRSGSGIHLRSARVAAAIASHKKGTSRVRAVTMVADDDNEGDKVGGGEHIVKDQTSATIVASLENKQSVTQESLGDLDGEEVIDHYVVHLTDCGDGGMPTLHTALTPASIQAGLAAGTLQPITIIETTTVPGGAGLMEAATLPVMGMSRSGEVVTTQVVVTGTGSGSQQTYVTCPAQLVDFSTGDPVLQGTESLLKASAEILQTASSNS